MSDAKASSTPLRLYNTMGRVVEIFKAIDPDRVLMYTCGPTVYHYIHIGNMRSFLTADVLRRVLEYNGYHVVHVKNITDVGHMIDEVAESGGDRLETAARKEGRTPQEVVAFYTTQYLNDEADLNLMEPSHRPKATEYVSQMLDLASRLIEKDHAYAVDGNVYFDVSSFATYGALSGNRQEDLIAGQRVEVEHDKRHPADFALWKRGDPARFMNWESPWGIGFPGWHIECSVMASSLLAPQIDIHTGGVDNLFPHHEDERAQSEADTGKRFVGYWVHSAHLLAGEEKMSRSMGNFATVSQLKEQGIHPLALRYFLLQGHYRKKMGWTPEALQAAHSGLVNLWRAITELVQEGGEADSAHGETYRQAFLEAINDDLGTPKALAVLQEVLGSDLSAASKLATIDDFDQVLGLDLLATGRRQSELTDEQMTLVHQRAQARAAREWGRSDEVRTQLQELGVEVKDTPSGQRWVRRDSVAG
jgi:cysteinyl-tRNA synthetase